MIELLIILYGIKETFGIACVATFFCVLVKVIFGRKNIQISKQIGTICLYYLFFQYILLLTRLTGIYFIDIQDLFSYIKRGYYMGIQFGFESIGHFIENIVMYIPLGILLSCMSRKVKNKYKFVCIVSLLSSIVIELLQGVIGRCSDISDIVSNLIGGVLGCVIYQYTMKQLKKKRVHL